MSRWTVWPNAAFGDSRCCRFCWFAAGHAKVDIPQAVDEAIRSTGFESIFVPVGNRLYHQVEPLGCHPRLLELSELRFDEAVADCPVGAAEDTALVMVGRGSRDSHATDEMCEFARLRKQVSSVAHVEVGFVAMAEPTIAECLERVAASGSRRVIVQPHLLFAGQLLTRISEEVAGYALRHPTTQWVVARHLGPHALLDAAIADVVYARVTRRRR